MVITFFFGLVAFIDRIEAPFCLASFGFFFAASTVYCWGYGAAGQLGDGESGPTSNTFTPLLVGGVAKRAVSWCFVSDGSIFTLSSLRNVIFVVVCFEKGRWLTEVFHWVNKSSASSEVLIR